MRGRLVDSSEEDDSWQFVISQSHHVVLLHDGRKPIIALRPHAVFVDVSLVMARVDPRNVSGKQSVIGWLNLRHSTVLDETLHGILDGARILDVQSDFRLEGDVLADNCRFATGKTRARSRLHHHVSRGFQESPHLDHITVAATSTAGPLQSLVPESFLNILLYGGILRCD